MARKILLADDSVTAQNMGRKILADAGYEVIAVNNGSAALKKIAELKPDLVILDVYMPGYSGLEVCQRLKESQETARIPVLLTVGKLEPFKPEEAQRVRAEGFIVKPFEASELLSALSKLEDKVVPRAEPSKPGRFARAIAAAEEAGRGSRKETAGGDNGWKSRIAFPHEKTEPEEKADESPIYNPMNRDLRTVVETPAELAAEKVAATQEKQHQAEKAAAATVDVAALAPANLPNDVTPEEVAAIAAAAAQIQMADAVIKDENQVSESRFTESEASAIATQASQESHPIEATLPPQPDVHGAMEAPADNKEEIKIESASGASAAAVAHNRRIGDKKPQEMRPEETRPDETEDQPVTMAATAESVVSASIGGSRWTAVSVALEADEAAISLDQEMQKAHAAFAAAETNSISASTAPELEPVPATNSAEESPVAAISTPEPQPVPEPEPAMSAIAEPEPVAAAQSEAAAPASSFLPTDFAAAEPVSVPEPVTASIQEPEATPLTPVTAEAAPVEEPREVPATNKFAEPNQEPAAVAEFSIPAMQTEVAASAAPAPQQSEPAPEPEPAIAEAAASTAFAPIVRTSEPAAEVAAEPKLDPETVKTTAAAWASWRQIRDTGKVEVAQAKPTEFDVPESAPAETAARAVAAGAEQIPQEASTARSGNPADVASIVDSVLADLRPKLMEEISRKMAEKK